jgi:ribonuclease P protein component
MVSRRMGSAVERNRVRRWVREALRPHLTCAESPFDIVVWVKRPVKELGFSMIAADVARWFDLAVGDVGAHGHRRGH